MSRLRASRQVGHRLTVAWLTLALLAITLWEPTSLRYRVVHDAGAVGIAVSLLIGLAALAALLDVALNDLRPRPLLAFLQRHRVQAYAVQGAVNLVLVWAMWRAGALTWVAAPYVVLACASFWISGFALLHELDEADHEG